MQLCVFQITAAHSGSRDLKHARFDTDNQLVLGLKYHIQRQPP
jgi:hypothetical protein